MRILYMFFMLFVLSSIAFAMSSKPVAGTFARCVYDVEQKAYASGLKNPWSGGDLSSWHVFTDPLMNKCMCRFYSRPLYTSDRQYSC